MKLFRLLVVLCCGLLSVAVQAQSAAERPQTNAEAQAVIARLAISGAVTLSNGTDDGVRVMIRPVTGIMEANDCLTDFAAGKATRLVGWDGAANHLRLFWSDVDQLELEPQGVRYNAVWVGQNKARFMIADPAARLEFWSAVNTLVENCRPGATRKAPVQVVEMASGGPRIALLIGNSQYGGSMGALPNSVRDVNLLGNTLRSLGFDVEVVANGDQRQMKRAISRLGSRMREAGAGATGFFFYAGHGVQSQGVNYLIPVSAPIEHEADLSLEAVAASDVLAQMEESPGSTSLVVLDACRNMPLQRSFRSGDRGLARMDAPNGSYIAYSTAPGAVAADGNGQNSPFALALNRNMQVAGLPIEAMFREVRKEVYQETGGKQTPWDSSSLLDTFVFNPAS